MRKFNILIPALCLVFAIPSNAQFSRGTIMLGTTIGSSAYSSANSDYSYDDGSLKSTGTNTYTFSVGPQVGVFLTRHLVLGATLSYNLNSSHGTSTSTNAGSQVSGSTSHAKGGGERKRQPWVNGSDGRSCAKSSRCRSSE